MRRVIVQALALAAVIGGGTSALAAPADVISARQQNYKQIGRASKAIQDELKGATPSTQVIATNAKTIAGLARHIPSWLPRGTGPEAGVKTGALPAIWERAPEFRHDAAQLVGAAKALREAAAKNDLARVTAAAPALGQACKTCHQSFRARD